MERLSVFVFAAKRMVKGADTLTSFALEPAFSLAQRLAYLIKIDPRKEHRAKSKSLRFHGDGLQKETRIGRRR